MSSYPQPVTLHWESRNGYVPPPRFQQLRTQDNQQQRLQSPLQNSSPPPLSVPPSIQGTSSHPSAEMSHSRTPSFFGFRTNKQPADNQHQRAQSAAGPGNVRQSNKPAPNPNPSRQGQPLLQNIPANQTQAQVPPNRQQPLPPLPQSQQPSQQQQPQNPPQPRPEPQPQQSSMNRTPNASQQAAPVTRSSSTNGVPQTPAPPPLHPEIRSVVQLTIAHAHKIYFSGPLVRRFERQPDGHKPSKDEGWTEVWAQLGGTTLSVWDMKEIQEASKQGREVPPSYINVTDAFIQVLGSVTVPATPTAPSKRYSNVITLNTAGSNLLLFSCPSTAALMSWAAALRLAAWEKSRLEEIYTAHLIRVTLNARDIPTTLVRGKMEGWARIRIAGQTDWKRVWLVVQEGSGIESDSTGPAGATVHATMRKNRMSNLFSRETNASNLLPPTKPLISMFMSPKPKDRKKPLLTVHDVSQAFGVYPERPELINRSTLLKVEGTFGDDDMAAIFRAREGWVLIMPELENNVGQAAEMLKWVVGLHDAFELYGRPEAWTWDPRDPVSLMFGYPVGPQKDNLFLEREIVEGIDPRDDRTSVMRSTMKNLLQTHLKPAVQVVQPRSPPRNMTESPPVLPPIAGTNQTSSTLAQQDGLGPALGPQLPPLSFGNNSARAIPSRDRPLTPITERSSVMTHARTPSMDGPSMLSPNHASYQNVASSNDGQQQPGNSPSGPSGAIPGPSTPNASPFISTSAAGGSTSTSVPILDRPISHSPPPTGANALLAHPQNGLVIDASSTITTISSAGLGTQSSSNSMNQGISSTSIATSATPESPEVRERTSFDTYSPRTNLSVSSLAGPSVQAKPPVPLGPGSAQPFPSFLLDEARFKTQDSTSSKSAADVTSLEPVSDADQKSTSPNLPSGCRDQANVNLQSQLPTSNTARSSPTDEPNDFINEAGALYYMQQSDSVASGHLQRGMQPHPDDDETSPDESDARPNAEGFSTVTKNVVDAKLPRRSTAGAFNGTDANTSTGTTVTNEHSSPKAMASSVQSGTLPIGRLSPTRSGLGRKPSGARAQSATTRPYNGAGSISSQTLTETDENMPSSHKKQTSDLPYDDPTGEAYAALTYLNLTDADIVVDSSTVPLSPNIEPLNVQRDEQPSGSSSQQPGPASVDAVPYKSTFAPTNKAAERKLKAQAQQAAAHAATHRPGRANGKRKMKNAGVWESSEEEEEDEEDEDDEEDDDMDSDGQKPMARGTQSISSSSNNAVRPQIQTTQTGPNDYVEDVPPTPSHLRPARNLPQIPPNRGQTGDFHQAQPMPRRQATDHADQYRRTHYEDGTPIRTQAEFPQPGGARQTVWSQVLDPGRTPGRAPQPDQPSNGRDTFVQLEPSETMTKAFTPQGLLSAGLQDKEDRSARRQEELARESGASLINVPNKPPPPQTGLLGAITAHERERKREGGVGAALTEREREKRLAEERQRRFDDHQRQQLDQMQQGGSLYGGQFGFNPMMMGMSPMMGINPMMTGNGLNPMMGGGMNPMMTGGGMAPFNPMMTGQMGYPGMMGGFNPQHMFAAQQAAQVYHQAMMAFSTAGSQVGGEGGNGGAPSQVNGMNPGMGSVNAGMGGMNAGMGNGMNPVMGGGMGGYDPRMSMMGMPMMGMSMGMGMGVASPQMNNQMPLGMQMTGMSTFDPKSSPGGANGSSAGELGLLPPNQNAQFSSRTSSPAGRGSPLARGGSGTVDRGRPSRPTSPK